MHVMVHPPSYGAFSMQICSHWRKYRSFQLPMRAPPVSWSAARESVVISDGDLGHPLFREDLAG